MKNCVDRGSTLLLWDADEAPAAGDTTVILWRGFGDQSIPQAVSIPQLIEAQAEVLRTRYLAWIYELGERLIRGRRVVDHLEFRPGFSYWWMTLFAEKCNYSKSPQITDAIRLMAFENWVIGRTFDSVVLVSDNQSLAKCIRAWCDKSAMAFEWRHIKGGAKPLSWVRRAFQSIPYAMQAFVWLARHLFACWPLRGVGLQEWQQTNGRVTIVSYLDNLVPDALKEGRFESRYWAHLPDDLQREGCTINWLHLYVKDTLLPTAGAAADVIREFNKAGRGEQIHVSLESFLSVTVVIKTLRDWCRLVWAGRRLKQEFSSSSGAVFDLWPLFEEDWQQSMSGITAISNALFLNLFESAFKSLPKQRVGAYLLENQGWEFALHQAWKAGGHGRLIGSPHSTVRYWDMRYFFDPRSYIRTGNHDLPLPDQLAFNGTAVQNVYWEIGFPAEKMVAVEALRFLHLCDARIDTDAESTLASGSIRVLVLGDYLLINTQQQMDLLEKALKLMPDAVLITVKPHPNCPVQPEDYPGLGMKVTMEPVSKLLAGCDVAYTSSVTSAAVDAYCAGVPVVSVLDPNILNQSPLRGRGGVLFASTPEELVNALISAASTPRGEKRQQDFFTLDPKLPRWKKLLLEAAPT